MTQAPRLKRKAKGERPYFFDDPAVDKVVAMVMGLAGEVAVMYDRLDTLERLLESRGLVKRGDIEEYLPPAKVMAERAVRRETMLGEILRIVEIELEGLASGDTEAYDSAIAAVVEDAAPALAGARKRRT